MYDLTPSEMAKAFDLSQTWRAYKSVTPMPLDHNRFGRHIRHNADFAIGHPDMGWVFGNINGCALVVSHWAPKSKKSGTRLLKQLLKHDRVLAFAVLPRMADQLQRIGYVRVGTTEQWWRGQFVEKIVVVNKKGE